VKVVLDTNVFVSGIFFGGPPGTVLEAWQDGRLELAMSLEIFGEYERVGSKLSARYPGVDWEPFLSLVCLGAELCDCPSLESQICADRDDDKFLACAIATGSTVVVSGDKLLLQVSEYRGVRVINPRDFVDQYLRPDT
jgi:putative PIN family toxin of toxin-antitoxin system